MTEKNEIGIVGLGRMGFRIGQRLNDKGYKVTGYDIIKDNRASFKQEGMSTVDSIAALCHNLGKEKTVLIFVPAGGPVDEVIKGLTPFLEKGDTVLDCGNSYYADAITRSKLLLISGVSFLDVGVSGGVSGARNGACLTIGGSHETFKRLEGIFNDISTENGYLYAGPSGWGHMIKTVHNGIEYGFLQAIGEGLELLNVIAGKDKVEIDLSKVCDVWNNGSIIESRLMKDAIKAVSRVKNDKTISGTIGGGETGLWAQKIAREYKVATPALNGALESRLTSRTKPSFTGKIIAAIRNVFGEHEVFNK